MHGDSSLDRPCYLSAFHAVFVFYTIPLDDSGALSL